MRTRTEGDVGERASHHDLLLVAAGEVGDKLVRPFRDDAKRLDRLPGCRGAARGRDESKRSERVRNRHRDIVGDRLRENEPLPVSAFRHAADAKRERRGNVARAQGRAVDPDRSGLVGPEPRHSLGDADAAAAGRAAKSDDLAARTEKLTSSKSSPPMLRTSSATERLGRRLSIGGVGETETHLLAGHRFDQRVLGQGRQRARSGCASRRAARSPSGRSRRPPADGAR